MRRHTAMTLAIAILSAALAASAPARAQDQALIDAAKREGLVTWYTALIIDQFSRPASEAFEKRYGVKVDYVRSQVQSSDKNGTADHYEINSK